MATAPTYTKSGAKASATTTLDKKVFDQLPENHQLLKDAYSAYLANKRINLAKTKDRGDVRGGGKKPWRQKGTGRARFGSIRNPIWTGGGVAFGPQGNENYSKKINKKANRQAIRQALSLAANEKRVSVVETLMPAEAKTKAFVGLIKKVGAHGRVLCVVDSLSSDQKRVASNVKNLKITSAKYLNVFDVLNADQVIITKKSLDTISDWLGADK